MPEEIIEHDYVHNWFGLTYCSYSVLPRSILQSMPNEWQRKFVDLMEELDAMADKHGVQTPKYNVLAKDKDGKFIRDPYMQYRHRGNVFKEK